MVSGKNYDLKVRCDLTRKETIQELFAYVFKFKPLVVVMSPQCTGLRGWADINAVHNPQQHEASVAASTKFAELCTAVAEMQSAAKRHWLVEQPAGSMLYKLDCWKLLLNKPGAASCVMHQCMAGLRGRKQDYRSRS